MRTLPRQTLHYLNAGEKSVLAESIKQLNLCGFDLNTLKNDGWIPAQNAETGIIWSNIASEEHLVYRGLTSAGARSVIFSSERELRKSILAVRVESCGKILVIKISEAFER
jgi:hypothetical protein